MKYYFVFFSLVFFFSSVSLVSAHILATDKSIGAVMHVDPNDSPVTGQQSSFFFEFKDKMNRFSPVDCSCTFHILENGKELYTQPLFQNSGNPTLSSASVFYTFQNPDVYQIKINGAPSHNGAFQPFTLSYDIRVEQGDNNTKKENVTSANNLPVIPLVVLVGGVGILLFRNKKKSKISQSKEVNK